jgi:hypothetical protein
LIFAIRKKLDPRIESEKTSIYLVAKWDGYKRMTSNLDLAFILTPPHFHDFK